VRASALKGEVHENGGSRRVSGRTS
jgi:hypothetical protein